MSTWTTRVGAVVLAALLLAGGVAIGRMRPPDEGPTVTGVPTDAVLLGLGEDLAAVMAANPPGTTYVLAAGVHRLQVLHPSDGDTIVGQVGAVMSGALELDADAFRRAGDVWVLGDRTEQQERHGEVDPGFERDATNHDLWAGAARLRHVSTRDAVDAPGEWFFDYDADEIVLGSAPDAAAPLELAVTGEAIRSDAADVVVRGLTVTRYASPAQLGAITADGPGWRITDVVVRDNHGTGVRLGDDGVLRSSRITGNGQLGVTAERATDVVVEDNEIARNGQLGYTWFWEAGGTKFKYTDGLVLRGNRVHDNAGVGLWLDLDNTDSVVSGNLVEDNEVMGLFLEVSEGIEVHGNTVLGNGFGPRADRLGAGISISDASDVVVDGNRLAGNAAELTIVHYSRLDAEDEPYTVDGVVVRDNHMTLAGEGSVGFYVDTDEEELYTDGSVLFSGNTYVLDGCGDCFRWGDPIDAEAWQSIGNDVGGTITTG